MVCVSGWLFQGNRSPTQKNKLMIQEIKITHLLSKLFFWGTTHCQWFPSYPLVHGFAPFDWQPMVREQLLVPRKARDQIFCIFFAVILTPKNLEGHIFHSFSRILPTSIFLGFALNKTIQFGWIIMTHTQTGGL